jgi:hypothetical protein
MSRVEPGKRTVVNMVASINGVARDPNSQFSVDAQLENACNGDFPKMQTSNVYHRQQEIRLH